MISPTKTDARAGGTKRHVQARRRLTMSSSRRRVVVGAEEARPGDQRGGRGCRRSRGRRRRCRTWRRSTGRRSSRCGGGTRSRPRGWSGSRRRSRRASGGATGARAQHAPRCWTVRSGRGVSTVATFVESRRSSAQNGLCLLLRSVRVIGSIPGAARQSPSRSAAAGGADRRRRTRESWLASAHFLARRSCSHRPCARRRAGSCRQRGAAGGRIVLGNS